MIDYLTTGDTKYIPQIKKRNILKEIDVALLIGVCNFGSPVANKCTHHFTKIKQSTGNKSTTDDQKEEKEVLALTFSSKILSRNNTLNTNFGYPYLLAYIVDKFSKAQ